MSGTLYDPTDHADVGAAPPLLAGVRNGKWLDEQDFPPLAYALPGVIPEGSVLLVGPPKIGKSWFVLTVALATSSGGRALGINVDRRPTLYLALEDGHRRLQDRCRKLLRGDPIPPDLDYLIRLDQGRILDVVRSWLDHQNDTRALVILDTLGKVMPPAMAGETSYSRDYRVGGDLHRITEEHPGMTLLVNHHDRKAVSDDFVDSVSGTHGLAGAADTVMVLCRDRQETSGLLKVTGRDVPEGEYAVTFTDGSSWALDGEDLAAAAKQATKVRATSKATANLGDRAIDVILYVHQHPDGVRAADVADALDLDSKTARTYLARAHQSGRLEKPERGLYTPVASVASVASEGAAAGGAEQGTLPLRNTSNTRNTPTEGQPDTRGGHAR